MSIAETRNIDPGAFERRRSVADALLLRVLASPWITAALIVAAIVQQAAGHLDCDVSWLITMAEKYLDGHVPYVDITDPNPPASFLSLVPAVSLARALHVAVEPVLAALVFAWAGISIVVSGHVLSGHVWRGHVWRGGGARSAEEWGALRNAAIYLLLITPAFVFAQREHLALIALAPMLAVLSVEGAGARPSFWPRLLAGASAGLAVCFKPFFALAILAPALATAWRDRSLRGLFHAEMWAVLAVAALYGAAVLVFFPAYHGYEIPLIVDVYGIARDRWSNLAFGGLAPVHAILLAGFVFVTRGETIAPAARVAAWTPAWASTGFLAAFFIQGKGWINHGYPGVALILFAWAVFVLDHRARSIAGGRLVKFLFIPLFAAAPALHGGVQLWSNGEEHPGLREAVARLAPAHPRVIAFARELNFGHPVTRQLEGTWVGRQSALWIPVFVAQLLPRADDPAYRARLLEYRREDLAALARDMRHGRPDVVIVEDQTTREWVEKQPETAGALEDYRKAGAVDEIEIWTRRGP
jgi:hypothetical protein